MKDLLSSVSVRVWLEVLPAQDSVLPNASMHDIKKLSFMLPDSVKEDACIVF